MTKPDDTLLLVSADHSHVFTLGGYGKRGKDIFSMGERDATYNSWDEYNGTDTENIHLSKSLRLDLFKSLFFTSRLCQWTWVRRKTSH